MPFSLKNWAQAARGSQNHLKWFLWILAFEFWLAWELPKLDLDQHTVLIKLIDILANLAPVIHNFDKIAPHATGLSLYFAITTLLIIPKSRFIFIWLNSSYSGMYRHFVISPLTKTSPLRADEFITEPLQDGDKPKEESRSIESRIFWSLAIAVFAVAMIFSSFILGWKIPKGLEVENRVDFVQLSAGGFWLWFTWSLKWATFSALMLAILTCIVRDYFEFFKSLTTRSKDHERS